MYIYIIVKYNILFEYVTEVAEYRSTLHNYRQHTFTQTTDDFLYLSKYCAFLAYTIDNIVVDYQV